MAIGLKTNSGHVAPQHSCCSGYKNTHYDLSTLTLKFSYLIEITASSFIINALLIKQYGFQLRGIRLMSIQASRFKAHSREAFFYSGNPSYPHPVKQPPEQR
jgi:hypothetical protein